MNDNKLKIYDDEFIEWWENEGHLNITHRSLEFGSVIKSACFEAWKSSRKDLKQLGFTRAGHDCAVAPHGF